jgi:ketosteroid isomerase-like protein
VKNRRREVKETGFPINKDSFARYLEAYNTGDYSVVIPAFYTRDAVFNNAVGARYRGQEDIIRFLLESHSGNIVRATLKPVRIIEEGESLAAEVDLELYATEDAPHYHIMPLKKGETIRRRMGVFYRLEQGKIAHITVYPPKVVAASEEA